MNISVLLKIFPILFLSFGFFYSAFSQEKIEREIRVTPREVPSEAKDWLGDAFEKIKRPKWYLEYSQNGKSYEAKFWHQKHFYSVEFDSLGKLEDVEIEIQESEVPVEAWKQIQSYFESDYEQVKVEKIQKQLTGSESDMMDFFDECQFEGFVAKPIDAAELLKKIKEVVAERNYRA